MNGPAQVNGSIDPTTHVPATASPIRIAGSFQMHARSQVSNDTLVILHFVLAGTSHTGTPANVLASYMSSFLSEPRLHFTEVEFDLAESSNAEPHAIRVVELFRQYQ